MIIVPQKLLGFSLLELTITVTVASILTTMAIPTFSDVISSNRLTTYSNAFVTSLNLARSEAIKRGIRVTVKRNSAPTQVWSTTSKEWHWGWDVFVDIKDQPSGNTLYVFDDDDDSNLCEVDASGNPIEDCLLRTLDALPSVLTLKSNSNFADTVSFNTMGKSTTGTLYLCDTSQEDGGKKNAKIMVVSATGRVRMDESGTVLTSCTPAG